MDNDKDSVANEARSWVPHPDPSSIVVPGLDTTAPITAQLEYVEQMITLRMQDIDSNFAKIHQILINRLLPAVKRYAQNSQPTREAASFWKSFFEEAAQVKVTVPSDLSSRLYTGEEEEEEEAEPEEEEEALSSSIKPSAEEPQEQEYTSRDHTPTDHSFITGAVSSTPLPAGGLASRRTTPHTKSLLPKLIQKNKEQDRSRAPIMQSPFAKLHQRVRKDLALDEPDSSASSSAAAAIIAGTPAAYKILRTPAKDAVRTVVNDILAELRGETPSPSLSSMNPIPVVVPPTPPSASRQRKQNFIANRPSALALGNYIAPEEHARVLSNARLNTELDDYSDDDDSMSDEKNHPPPPPPLFANAREEDEEDESFAHSDDDSDSDDGPEDGGNTVQPHPLFAAAGLSNSSSQSSGSSALRRDLPAYGGGDESDEEQTSTLFGRREEFPDKFFIMGQVQDTYHGGRLEDSEPMVASPTPFPIDNNARPPAGNQRGGSAAFTGTRR